MSAEVVQWVCGQLSILLSTETTEDIARYVLSMGNARDLEEYMNDLLDQSDPRTKVFIDELLSRWCDSQRMNTASKKHMNDSEMTTKLSNKQKKKQKSKANSGPEQTNGVKANHTDLKKLYNGAPPTNSSSSLDVFDEVSPGGASEGGGSGGGSGTKKKTTFLPLFSSEGQERTVARLPGRHVCDCQAMKHPLVNNCLQCGRIVCEQEGSGPCFFCKTLVCTRAEQEVLSRNSKKSNQLREQLTNVGSKLYGGAGVDQSESIKAAEQLSKAIAHKNRLLEYDRTSVKRTQVIDDESDYFATEGNQWLNKNEKQALAQRETELRNQRHVSRLDRRVTLDFAGRRVVEDDTPVDVYNANDSVVQAINFGVNDPNRLFGRDVQVSYNPEDFSDDLVNPHIKQLPPKFISDDVADERKPTKRDSVVSVAKKTLRIQDAELQRMSDTGMALSMHQPWASLLVAGIKLHEGRSWYTPHRGVLWIAATAKQASREEIEITERQYRLCTDPSVVFPKDYPTACLLGCVEVVDCLAQDDYQLQYPQGESESPFVFICENPQQLLVKFPIVGRHKLYKLEGDMHKAAKRGLHKSTASLEKKS